MLITLFPSLKNNRLIKAINWFFYSYYYVGLIALLTALCSIFSFEMYAFYTYVICGCIIPCLFCKDMTPLLAPLSMAYSSVSLKANNSTEGISLFGDRWYHLYIILGLIFTFVIIRLIFNLITDKNKRHYKHYLLIGYLTFGVTLMTAGINTPYYNYREFTFGLVEFLSLFGSYFLLMYLIDWKDMKKGYFAWLMMLYGLAICIEVIVTEIIDHGTWIKLGWGIDNNVAGQLCMCLAAPIYLAFIKKPTPVFFVIESLILLCIGFTNSRNGVVMGLLLGISLLIVFIIKSTKWKRISAIITVTLCIGTFLGFFFGFYNVSELVFSKLLNTFDNKQSLLTLSGRIDIWKGGWQNFLSNRSFGTGWYQCPIKGKGPYFNYGFIPPRYHNTLFQLLGALGTFGLVTYIYHRYQTIRMTFYKPSLEKTFIFISILGLLLTSLFDCHLFNLGPGLNYCIALASIEGINIRDGVKIKESKVHRFFKSLV